MTNILTYSTVLLTNWVAFTMNIPGPSSVEPTTTAKEIGIIEKQTWAQFEAPAGRTNKVLVDVSLLSPKEFPIRDKEVGYFVPWTTSRTNVVFIQPYAELTNWSKVIP